MNDNGHKLIAIPEAPQLPGLSFRRFRGPSDYPAMVAVIDGSKGADGLETTESVEDVTRNYRHLTNCEPYQDMVFAEVQRQVVGYGRVWWIDIKQGQRMYNHFAFLLPDWRGTGIRRAMLRRNEQRALQIAASHPAMPKQYQAWAADTEHDWNDLLLDESYQAVRYGIDMVRPDLEDIPDLPLPEGIVVRPVQPEHLRAIHRAAQEAFRDEWDYSEDEFNDEQFDAWQEQPTFQPELWQVAWDGDQVVGMVMNFIDHDENREYNRLRGYTEGIAVRRPWRRRGVARALIARSLRLHRELGMKEAALGADAENPSGAVRLYKFMGFEAVKVYTTYRKPLVQPERLTVEQRRPRREQAAMPAGG